MFENSLESLFNYHKMCILFNMCEDEISNGLSVEVPPCHRDCPSENPDGNWESMELDDGSFYEGFVCCDRPHYFGKIFQDGEIIYMGEFDYGLKHGLGLEIGIVMNYGTYQDGKKHGKFVTMYPVTNQNTTDYKVRLIEGCWVEDECTHITKIVQV